MRPLSSLLLGLWMLGSAPALIGCNKKEPAPNPPPPPVNVNPFPVPNVNPPPVKQPVGGIARRLEGLEVQNIMRQLGIAYRNYEALNSKAPRSFQDLMTALERNAQIEEALKEKWIVFIYGVRPQDMTQGTSNTILAFEAQADRAGRRFVLMGDGQVTTVDESEFKKAVFAGK
jgi:hypothetical protein